MQKPEQEYLYELIGEKIKKLRRKSRFSQEQLAKKLGLSRVSIVNIEKGRQHPSLHLLIDMTRVLNVELNSFLNDGLLNGFDNHSHKLSRLEKEIIKTSGKNIDPDKIISFIKYATQKPS